MLTFPNTTSGCESLVAGFKAIYERALTARQAIAAALLRPPTPRAEPTPLAQPTPRAEPTPLAQPTPRPEPTPLAEPTPRADIPTIGGPQPRPLGT